LTTGAKIMVKERVEEVIEAITVFRRKIFGGPAHLNVLHHQAETDVGGEG